MSDVSFRLTGTDMETGESLYRLTIDGIVVREKMTLDEVVREINTREIESEARGLPSCHPERSEESGKRSFAGAQDDNGRRKRTGNTDCHTSAAALVRNDGAAAPREAARGKRRRHGNV